MKIKKLNAKAVIPTRGSESAAGYDLYACSDEPIRIGPHETVMINTGIAIAIPEGDFGAIFARSGLASKKGLRPANAVGVIDADYRGEIIVALHNDTKHCQEVVENERIAQMVFIPFMAAQFEETEELPGTKRGTGGFGSTGTT